MVVHLLSRETGLAPALQRDWSCTCSPERLALHLLSREAMVVRLLSREAMVVRLLSRDAVVVRLLSRDAMVVHLLSREAMAVHLLPDLCATQGELHLELLAWYTLAYKLKAQ